VRCFYIPNRLGLLYSPETHLHSGHAKYIKHCGRLQARFYTGGALLALTTIRGSYGQKHVLVFVRSIQFMWFDGSKSLLCICNTLDCRVNARSKTRRLCRPRKISPAVTCIALHSPARKHLEPLDYTLLTKRLMTIYKLYHDTLIINNYNYATQACKLFTKNIKQQNFNFQFTSSSSLPSKTVDAGRPLCPHLKQNVF